MKTKICLKCGKEFVPTSGVQKYCPECRIAAYKAGKAKWGKQYNQSHKKERKEYYKQYYKDNKEKIKEHDKQYYKDHKEEKKEYRKQWKKDNKQYYKQWYKDHTEEVKEQSRQYWQTPAGKEAQKRANAKRRELGFILLNDYFEGSVAHHMNKEQAIYIPEELHRSVYHNVFTGQNMTIINFKALQYMISTKTLYVN